MPSPLMYGWIKSVKPLRSATEADVRVKHGRPIQVGDLIDGFCFVKCDDGVDRFAHRSEMPAGLDITEQLVGLRVSFIAALHAKGPRCLGVQLVTDEGQTQQPQQPAQTFTMSSSTVIHSPSER